MLFTCIQLVSCKLCPVPPVPADLSYKEQDLEGEISEKEIRNDTWLYFLTFFHVEISFSFSFLVRRRHGTRVWTWGLVLARQALYHLSHAPSPRGFLLSLYIN
jgi:hypothetical protein